MPSRLHAKRGSRAKVAARRKPRQQPGTDQLQTIPGVGPSIARDLRDLGIHRVQDLRGRDPEQLYQRLIAQRGMHQDRCLLYVFRCAVYYAGTARPRAELLQWWRWKDRN